MPTNISVKIALASFIAIFLALPISAFASAPVPSAAPTGLFGFTAPTGLSIWATASREISTEANSIRLDFDKEYSGVTKIDISAKRSDLCPSCSIIKRGSCTSWAKYDFYAYDANGQKVSLGRSDGQATGVLHTYSYSTSLKVKSIEGVFAQQAGDWLGNNCPYLSYLKATLYTTPFPTASISHSPLNPHQGQPVTIEVTASDSVAGIWYIEIFVKYPTNQLRSVAKCYQSPCSYTERFAEGDYSYRADILNKAGNYGYREMTSFTVTKASAPAISVSHTPANPQVGRQVKHVATATDDFGLSNLYIVIDGNRKDCPSSGLSATCEWDATWTLTGGHQYLAGATDTDGNTANSDTKYYEVSAPFTLTPGTPTETTIPIRWDSYPGDSYLGTTTYYQIVIGPNQIPFISASSTSYTIQNLKRGTEYTIKVYALTGTQDKPFILKESNTIKVKTAGIVDTTPPTVSLSITPQKPLKGDDVTITASATDDNSLAKIEIWLSDSTPAKSCTFSISTLSGTCTYIIRSISKSYSANANAYDADGNSNVGGMGIVLSPPPNKPPIAYFTPNVTSGYAPLDVKFNASGSSDPDGEVLTYYFIFGDGTTNSPNNAARIVSHTYTKPGTYAVNLTVMDDKGAYSSTRKAITVSEVPVITQTINIKEGWNLIAWPGDYINRTSDCVYEPEIFVYDPSVNDYITMPDAQQKYGIDLKNVLSRNSFWAYSSEDCVYTFAIPTYQTYKGTQIRQGWNFLAITDDMKGMKFGLIRGNCEFTEARRFNTASNNWVKFPLTTIVPNSDRFSGVLVYSNNSCTL